MAERSPPDLGGVTLVGCIGCSLVQASIEGTLRNQPGRPVCRYRTVEHCDVAPPSCYELSTFDRSEDRKRLVLNCVLSCFQFSKQEDLS